MLPFDDRKWGAVSTFYDDNLASVLREWTLAVGFDQEAGIYDRLFNLYLHQNTTTNAAIVVVPFVVKHCQVLPPNDQAAYLTDVATVEYCRLRHGCCDGSPELDWAMQSYHGSVEIAEQLVERMLYYGIDSELDVELRALQPVLYGNLQLAIDRHSHRGTG